MKKLMILAVALVLGMWVHAQSTNVEYYKNGNVKTATYTEGTYTEVTEYFKNGNLKSVSRFVNGVPHGIWQEYDKHETLISEGTYSYGKKTGEWLVYNIENKKIYKVTYRNDQKVAVSEWAHGRE